MLYCFKTNVSSGFKMAPGKNINEDEFREVCHLSESDII